MDLDPLPDDTRDRMSDAAIRGAEAIVARAERDALDAEAAREHYRNGGAAALDPDAVIAPHLWPGERLLATRTTASLELDGQADVHGLAAGPLYITDARLLVLAHRLLDIELRAIDEIALTGERLLLSLRDGTGVTIDTPGPRLLRVQIAAALVGARG